MEPDSGGSAQGRADYTGLLDRLQRESTPQKVQLLRYWGCPSPC